MNKDKINKEKINKSEGSEIKGGVSYTVSRLYPYLKRCRLVFVCGLLAMLIVASLTVAFGQAVMFSIENVPSSPELTTSYFTYILLGAIGVVCIYCVASFLRIFCIRLVAVRVTESLRKDIFRKILYAGASYVESQNSGEIQTRIIADTEELGGFLAQQIPLLIKASLMLCFALGACYYVNISLALIVTLGLPIVVSPFIISSKPLRKIGSQMQKAFAEVGSHAGETFRHIKVVHAFNQFKNEKEMFSQYVDKSSRLSIRAGKLHIGLGVLVESLCFIYFAIIFYFAAMDIIAEQMTIGELVAFGFYVQAIVIAAKNVVNVSSSVNLAVGTASRIIDYLDSDIGSMDSEEKIQLPQIKGSVEFVDVHFSYPNRPDVEVLSGVNMRINAGVFTSIVGPSGAGKSTILELIMKIYIPTSGKILVDGVDINELSREQMCESIAFMPQQDFIRTGSVIENIRYGDSSASEEDVVIASKQAQADGFVSELPDGYESDLGEVGGRLSGGQKQRLSLARALVKKPALLLLDEPTSALDEECEKNVSQVLDALNKNNGTTIVNVTHNISNARQSDEIIVIFDGKVDASGSHEYLLKNSHIYSQLASREDLETHAELKNIRQEEALTA